MELKSIKVAGFKSFADPTVIPLQSRLTAVVGPNGCGKSNIVDAVRCVLSGAAKQLRGGTLGDIIFNGSTHRKPVGRAVVELILDNSAGRLQGEYAAYHEICIRREITRDGDSQYYLNGTRCRRRDAVDVVLGTGLKYAIIEQGMVTSLIEAKPEELRVYLEEAAGISKYKERRRETENRLRHTRENLERLNDLRAELDKQLQHLQRQANAAERYKTLKQEERLLKAQWQAFCWQALGQALTDQQTVLQHAAAQLEEHQSQHEQAQAEITRLRRIAQEENTTLQTMQTRYYEHGAVIVRLEQQLKHHQQRAQQLTQELTRLAQSRRNLQQQNNQDQQRLAALEQELAELAPHLTRTEEQANLAQQQLQQAEENFQQGQSRWDTLQQQTAQIQQQAEIAQTRLRHSHQVSQTTEQRIAKIQQEQQSLVLTPLEQEIAQLTNEIQSLQRQLEETQTCVHQTLQQITQQRTAHAELLQRLDAERSRLQQARGRYDSLQALQQAALGNDDEAVAAWLQTHQLQTRLRLGQTLQVEPGWELAVETVLGSYLQALCVDDLAPLVTHLEQLPQGQLTLLERNEKAGDTTPAPSLLLSKIANPSPLEDELATIYAVETTAEALALRPSLKPHESVITRAGIWLAKYWGRIAKAVDVKAGILQRQAELQTLAKQITAQAQAVEATQQACQQAQTALAQLEQQREQTQQQLRMQTSELGQLQAQLSANQARAEQMQQRSQQLAQEIQEAQQQLAQAQQQMQEAEQQWQQATQALEQLTAQRQILLQERDQQRQAVDTQRQQTQQARQLVHQLQLRLETLRQQQHFLQQALQRAEQQQQELADNQQALERQLEEATTPQATSQQELQTLLEQRTAAEINLQQIREQVTAIQAALAQQEKIKQALEGNMQQWRDTLEQARLQLQTFELKQASHQEKLQELGFTLEDLLPELPSDTPAKEWEEKIVRLEQRIQRLGAINLAAIEEHQQLAERKQYLDAQNDDLLEALATLESAIRKIDRESRTRLQETYDKVNESFKTLFQRIFNGGQASLELTHEDWLSSGIIVRAQPPGKRNSTIHLLSGGEKSLTAVALIFALFQLNPSPFCILDEVDAALDDINVMRFCHLVKEMAQQVQFIFISHNKQTIAMAEQLIGITMHEPGVSRMVTVDVQEAIAMAA